MAKDRIQGRRRDTVGTFLKRTQLSYFSKPAHERHIYRMIARRGCARFVELGVGNAQRAERMIRMAATCVEPAEIRYTGVDLFEAQPGGMPLKEVYRRLKATGAKVRLLPGDPFSALARSANDLTGSDLITIAHDVDLAALGRAWFYVPRLLHESTLVFRIEAAGEKLALRLVSHVEIEQLAQPGSARKAA